MARARTHVLGATVAYGVYIALWFLIFAVDEAYRPFSALEIIAATSTLYVVSVLFGLWPDIDTDSHAQTIFYTIFLIADGSLIYARQYEAAAYFGLLAMLPILSKHRSWTHSIWAMLLIPLPLLILPALAWPNRPLVGVPLYGAALAGYASHLFLDHPLTAIFRRRR